MLQLIDCTVQPPFQLRVVVATIESDMLTSEGAKVEGLSMPEVESLVEETVHTLGCRQTKLAVYAHVEFLEVTSLKTAIHDLVPSDRPRLSLGSGPFSGASSHGDVLKKMRRIGAGRIVGKGHALSEIFHRRPEHVGGAEEGLSAASGDSRGDD